MRLFVPLALTSMLLSLGACVTAIRPSKQLGAAQTRAFTARVLAHGQDGDWLVVRGYKAADDMVATVTNTPLSHVAVLDRGKEQVIEAEGKGVHLSPLASFVGKSHRVILIRPIWAAVGGDAAALRRAHAAVGKKYDFLGTVGLNRPGRFYCSELAVHIYRDRVPRSFRFPPVIEPGKLYYYGRIIYDSGDRTHRALKPRKPTTQPSN